MRLHTFSRACLLVHASSVRLYIIRIMGPTRYIPAVLLQVLVRHFGHSSGFILELLDSECATETPIL